MKEIALYIYPAGQDVGSEETKAVVNKWKFYDSMMGEQYVMFSLTSEVPIDWKVGDFCVFRGETFKLNYIPSLTQKSRTGERQDSYTYENVKFDSLQEELTRCIMLDITLTSDKYIAALGTNYTGSSKFSLFCGEAFYEGKTLTPVNALALKILANLNRMYGDGVWNIYINDENTHTDDKLLNFDNTTALKALQEVHNTFDLDYCIRGRNIYIGYRLSNLTSDDEEHAFSFGYGRGYPTHEDMNKGLFQIKRISNSQQKIVTRLRALGSKKNLPYRYYNKKYADKSPDLSQTLFPTNLQLPDTFETPAIKEQNNALRDPSLRKVKGDTNDAYIDKNDDAVHCPEGVREECARWDGTDSNLPEIYPTIEGATYGELRSALVEDQDGKKGGDGSTSSSAFYPYRNEERIDKLLGVGRKDGNTVYDDANIGNGILPESGLPTPGTVRGASVDLTDLSFNTINKGNFNVLGSNLYGGEKKKLFSIPGVTPGHYAMAPTIGAVFYGFSLECERSGCSADVGYILTIEIQNSASGTIRTITYQSDFQNINRESGILEMELPALPDVKENQRVTEIEVSSLSDVVVSFTPVMRNPIVPQGFTGDFHINYQVGNSRLDTTVTYAPEYTWFPLDDHDTLTDRFHVLVQDMGFDIQACWTDETPVISMKSGKCVGREFEILDDVQKVEYGGKKGYMLTLKRSTDTSLNTYYPSEAYPLAAGDQFVLLNISMPDTYIQMAEVRLLRAATDYLADNSETQFTWQPYIDDLYLQRNLDLCRAENREEESIFWRLYAGLKFTFLARFESESSSDDISVLDITIEKVVITMGESLTPKVEITLNDDIQQSTIEKLTTSVDRIYNGSIFSGGAGGASLASMTTILMSLFQSEGDRRYLSKTKADTAMEVITFVKGILFGNAGKWGINGDGVATLNELTVNKLEAISAHFFELIIDKVKSVGGQIIVTPANAEITRVVEVYNSDDEPKLIGWKCYWPNTDGDKTIYNEFEAGDQVICASFNQARTGHSEDVSNKFYWRLCVETGIEGNEHFIFLDADKGVHSDYNGIPEVGDNIVQLGFNKEWAVSEGVEVDTDRQHAIIISAYNHNFLDTEIKAPSFVQYTGIEDFSLAGYRLNVFSPSGNEFTGTFRVVSGADLEKVGRIVYKSSPTRPDTPTGTTIPPDGWSMEPTEEHATLPFTLSYSGDWTNIGDGEWKSNQISDEQVTRERVTFQTTGDAVIYVRLTSDSEGVPEEDEWYDIIGVGNVDVDMSWAGYDDLGDGSDPDYFAGRCTGQGNSVVVQLKVTGAGQHFFDVLYWKDSSVSVGGDYGTFKILDGDIIPIWASVFDGIGTWSVPVRWNGTDGKIGQDGTSPIVVDLSNEMDAVACNAGGEVTAEQSVTTTVRPYKGTTALSITNIAVKIGSETIGTTYGSDKAKKSYYVKATTNTATGLVTVYFRQGRPMSTPAEVSIVVTCDDKEYTLTFTVTGMRPGADGTPATIYNLLPNPSVIKTAQVSGGYSPATASVVCGYTKNVGGVMTTVPDVSEQIDGTYNIYFRRRSRSSGNYETGFNLYSSERKSWLSALPLSSFDAVEFILCTNTDTPAASSLTGIIDRETVPVIADGLQGSDAITYKLTPVVEQALVDKDKKLTLSLNYQLWKYTGNTGTQVSFEGFKVYCKYKVGNTTTIEYQWSGVTGNTISLNRETVTGYSGNPLYYTVELYYINGNNEVLVDRRIVQVSMSAKVVFEVGEDAVTSAVANISNVKNYFGFNRGASAYNSNRWNYQSQSGTWTYDNGDTPATTVNNSKMRITFSGARKFTVILYITGGTTSDKLYIGNLGQAVSTSNYKSVRSGSGQLQVTLEATASSYFEVLYVKSSSTKAYFAIYESESYRCQLWPYGYGFFGFGRYCQVNQLGMLAEDQGQTWTLYFEAKSLSSGEHLVRPLLCSVKPVRINRATLNSSYNGVSISSSEWRTFICEFPEINSNFIGNNSHNGILDFNRDESNISKPFAVRNVCLVKGQKPYLQFVKAEEDMNYAGGLQEFSWLNDARCIIDTSQTFMGMKVWRNSVTVGSISDNYIEMFSYGNGSTNGITIKDGQPYTLSFWAKASVDGAFIHSHLYNSNWNLFRPIGGGDGKMYYSDGLWKTELSTQWKRYTVHWVPNLNQAPNSGSSNYKYIKSVIGARLVKDTANNSATVYIAGMTMQEGWVDEGQSTVAFSMSEMKQTADGITTTVKNLQGTVNGHTEDISAVKQTSYRIESTVKNMKVGGRNLILNGAFNYDSRYWSDWGSPSKREITTDSQKKKWMHIRSVANDWQGYSQFHFNDFGITIQGGKKYTISFRAKGTYVDTQTISVGFHWRNHNVNANIKQDWFDFTNIGTSGKDVYQKTFDVPATGEYNGTTYEIDCFNFMIGQKSSISWTQDFSITDIQLEEGTMATDWRESIEENHSLIEQTAGNIRLEVESCGINISEKQITLDGNTQVNGNLNLNSSDQGFTIAGNEGSTQISPQSVGKVATATNTYATTVSDSVVSQLVQRSSDQYDGTFIMSQTFGKINSGAQISGYSSSSWLTFMKPNSGSVVSAISYSITYGIYINNVLRYPIEITSSTIGVTWTQRVDYTGELKIMVTITASFSASAVETSTTISAVPSLRCAHIYKLTLPTSIVRTLIGYDGMRMSFGNNNSVFFGSDGALIKYGSYGLKVTSDGLQRLNDGAWVGFNVKETATITASAAAFNNLTPIGDSVEVAMVTSGGDQYKIRLPNNPHNGQILRVYNISSHAITIWANKQIRWNETTYSAGSEYMSLDNYRGCEIIYHSNNNSNVWHAHKFTE